MSFLLPTNCPSCNSVLVWKGVDLACVNSDCGTTKVKSLASFLIKCGVEGVTETSLVNWGITGYRSLLSATFHGGNKPQVAFLAELNRKVFSKTKEELFACMTFDGCGSTNIKKILDFYGNDLESVTKNLYLNHIYYENYPEGIGEKIITKIEESWKKNLYLLNFILKDSRYNPQVKVVTAGSNKLDGKSFCITGTLSKPRKHFENLVTDNGGTLSSVSKKLSFLIVGTDAGSKEDKAKSLGVTILTEDVFMGML